MMTPSGYAIVGLVAALGLTYGTLKVKHEFDLRSAVRTAVEETENRARRVCENQRHADALLIQEEADASVRAGQEAVAGAPKVTADTREALCLTASSVCRGKERLRAQNLKGD